MPGFDSSLVEMVPADLIRKANVGRDVLGPDGYFLFPEGVTRVWVDVGAHHLETTLPELMDYADLALIAVEPLSEAWAEWPDEPRIIGLRSPSDASEGPLTFM